MRSSPQGRPVSGNGHQLIHCRRLPDVIYRYIIKSHIKYHGYYALKILIYPVNGQEMVDTVPDLSRPAAILPRNRAGAFSEGLGNLRVVAGHDMVSAVRDSRSGVERRAIPEETGLA